MIKSISFNISEADWKAFTKGNAQGIYAKDIDPESFIKTLTIKLMKVKPGGEFPLHIDPYSHIFYLLDGVAEGELDGDVYVMKKGHVTIVKAGVKHGYRNIGSNDLYLLTMNIPEDS